MIERTRREIADFFGVEVEDVSGRYESLRLKGARKPVLMAVSLQIRAFKDVVQNKSSPVRGNETSKGKRSPVFHGRKSKDRGART